VDKTVTFTLTGMDAGLQQFQLMGVTNPTATGGSGNFKVRNYSNGFEMDVNDIYPTIGITDVPAVFSTHTFAFDGNSFSRYKPNYRMKFKPSKAVPKNSDARVTFPAGYILSVTSMSCEL
jgi:hypothetical protein